MAPSVDSIRQNGVLFPDSLGDISAEMARQLIDYGASVRNSSQTPPPTFGRGATRGAGAMWRQDGRAGAGAGDGAVTPREVDSPTRQQHVNGSARESFATTRMHPSSTNGTAFFEANTSPRSTRTRITEHTHGGALGGASGRDSVGRSFIEDAENTNLSGKEADGDLSHLETAMTAPKLGGFGVRDNHLVPHVDGMRSAADERAKRPAASGQEPMQWGQFFWTIITDPQSSMSFFANPHTGECRWEVPAGTFVLPPDPEGQWWELFDSLRGIPYYYHTTTHKTQWQRPRGLVIPMTAIQESAGGKRFSRQNFGVETLSALAVPTSELGLPAKVGAPGVPASLTETPKKRKSRQQQPPPPVTSPSIEQVLSFDANERQLRKSQLIADAMESASPRALRSRVSTMAFQDEHVGSGGAYDGTSSPPPQDGRTPPRRRQLGDLATQPIPEAYGDEQLDEAKEMGSTVGGRNRRQSARLAIQRGLTASLSNISSSKRAMSPDKQHQQQMSSSPSASSDLAISLPLRSPEEMLRNQPGRTTGSSPGGDGPIRFEAVESSPQQPRIPPELIDELGGRRVFDMSDFAVENFSQHRTGFFRRKMPVDRMLKWQKEPISAPMLNLPRSSSSGGSSYQRDAITIFKVIQRACGDRPTCVHAVVPPPLQAPSQTMSAQEFTERHKKLVGNSGAKDSPPTVLEEIRWALDVAIVNSPLRDEIFVQLMKQLTDNPDTESTFRGWQFLCVLLSSAFPPSRDLHSYLASWIAQRIDAPTIGPVAEYCLGRLEAIQKRGPRGKAPSLIEIQCALENPFNPGVFGIAVEKAMQMQERAYPNAQVPIVLTFLTDAMLALDALKTRGIFRISGSPDQVIELRVRIERGHYSLNGLLGHDNSDVTVPASVFKLWLRELEEPLIPQAMYNACVDAAAAQSSENCIELVAQLPMLHRRVVLFVISFLQMFCRPSALRATQLTVDSLSLIFAPNFFRMASDQLQVAWRNAYWEQQFIKILLENMDCATVDPEYVPKHGEGPEGTMQPGGGMSNGRRGKGKSSNGRSGAAPDFTADLGMILPSSGLSTNGFGIGLDAGESSPEVAPLALPAGFLPRSTPFAALDSGKQTLYASESSADL
ncbi:hypothetical protein K437DRAFT_254998 [Tilletiaria anomala UBC 951]|uniref:RhoGAP-domain-containing protein n=1 Tax=Tilletiaria anomala (strain ATCC 24038 / CBS 436.72 / UBC 951) TaxID=1037660 RepID=A0A066WIJ4_TILAU|nr:uncharacterized protein K437DRAFT_254998 [Tilletiaria anomala UBC 951]KDN50829.1 hypothetical protein K437DRAFT_254998 [Tilletiaria anomala UBC 951]